MCDRRPAPGQEAAPPETLTFEPSADVPNHAWPVLLYRGAVEGGADAVVERLAQNRAGALGRGGRGAVGGR